MTLRILQLIETGGPGGAETVFAQLASALRSAGYDVHAFVGDGNWLPDEMHRRELAIELMRRSDGGALALVRRLRHYVQAHEIDLVHAHLFDGALFAALAARSLGVPCVATLHGQVDVREAGIKARVKHALFRHSVSCTVAVSDALRRDLQPVLRLPTSKFRVIHNGLERDRSVDTSPAGRELPAFSSSHPFRLVALGNIRPAKDYPTLLEAIARLRDGGCPVHLDIAGQPDTNGLYESLLNQRAELGLDALVKFLGFVADPAPLLRQSDCFVLASSQEGFSLATIEAMLGNVPVVATRSGGPQEIIRDEETGLLVPTKSPEELADAIRRVMADTALAQRLTAAAAADARVRFSVDAMVHAYIDLYTEMLSGSRRGGP